MKSTAMIGGSCQIKGPMTLDELEEWIAVARHNRPPKGAHVEMSAGSTGGFMLTVPVTSVVNPKRDQS